MKALGPRYMLAFSCIGNKCEDTCCREWSIPVDPETHRRLKTLAPDDRETANWIARGIVGDGETARQKLDDNGNCAFLREGLCGLQRRFGESHLPAGCAAYPRRYNLISRHLEIMGSLSCPEICRACLLDGQAMEIVDIELASRPRMLMSELPRADHNTYIREFESVRHALLDLLASVPEGFGHRLFLFACTANHLTGFFRRDCGALTAKEVQAQLANLSQARTLAKLGTVYAESELHSSLPMAVVASALFSRARGFGTASFKRLLRDVWQTYGLDFECELNDAAVEKLWAGYRQRRERWTAQHGDRLEQYLGNYALNFVLSELYTDYPDLNSYARELLLRTAMLRFLVVGHPALHALTPDRSADETGATLDAAAVDAFMCFSRDLEHNQELLAELRKQVRSQGLDTLAHLALFTKF